MQEQEQNVESESFRIASGHVEGHKRGNYENAYRTGVGRGEFYLPRQEMLSRSPASSGSRTTAKGLTCVWLLTGEKKNFSSVSDFALHGLMVKKAYTSVFNRCAEKNGFLDKGWLVWFTNGIAPTETEISQAMDAYKKILGEKS